MSCPFCLSLAVAVCHSWVGDTELFVWLGKGKGQRQQGTGALLCCWGAGQQLRLEEWLRFGAKLSTSHIGHLSVPGLMFSGVNQRCLWIQLAGKFGNAEKLCCARLGCKSWKNVICCQTKRKKKSFSQLKCFSWRLYEKLRKNRNERFQNLIKLHRQFSWTKSKWLFSNCSNSMFWLFWIFPPIFFFPWVWKCSDTKPFLQKKGLGLDESKFFNNMFCEKIPCCFCSSINLMSLTSLMAG